MNYVVWIVDGGSPECPDFYDTLVSEIEAESKEEAIFKWVVENELYSDAIVNTDQGSYSWYGRKVHCKLRKDVELRKEINIRTN